MIKRRKTIRFNVCISFISIFVNVKNKNKTLRCFVSVLLVFFFQNTQTVNCWRTLYNLRYLYKYWYMNIVLEEGKSNYLNHNKFSSYVK